MLNYPKRKTSITHWPKGVKCMKQIICLSIFWLSLTLTLNASAEELSLQAAVPGNAGTIALRVTLDEASPVVMENYSGIVSESLALPEPATLGLLGLGVLGLMAVGMRRKHQGS